jgi:DNA polymerase-4
MGRILHVDMDAFFAAVELGRRPELADKPVVVGGRGDPASRGVVSTASYQARRFGIHSGMPLRVAHRRCSDAVFLPVDYPTYLAVSKRVKAVLRNFSSLLEDVGIDEAYLDVSAAREPATVLAAAIKQAIKNETGLTCSVGIGPNKLLAKMASDLEKPDGLTVIGPNDIDTRIWPLPLRKLPGVGPKTERRLHQLSLRTIGDLAALGQGQLVAELGPSHGRYLHQAAHGIDRRPIVTHWEPKSISRETTFERDVADEQFLMSALESLTEEVVQRLQARRYRAKGVTVKLRYANFDTHTRATTLAAASDEFPTIMTAASHCLHRFVLTRKVRLLGVRVATLSAKRAERNPEARDRQR